MSYLVWSAMSEFARYESTSPVVFLVNSGGGSFVDLLSIVDAMSMVRFPIMTIGTGLIASGAVGIISSGTKGMRCLTPGCTVMTHSLSWYGDTGNPIEKLTNTFKETKRLQDLWEKRISSTTGLSIQETRKLLTDRDKFMTPREAIKYGIADRIFKKFLS